MKQTNKAEDTVVEQQVDTQQTMTLNEVLREISYQQWLVSREEGDVYAARGLLQKLYEMRDAR